MPLSDIKAHIFKNTNTNATSYPAADMVLDINAACKRVNTKVRKFLDNFRPTDFTTSDLTTGTATPKFDADFHELVPLYVSLNRANAKALPGYNGWLERAKDLEEDLETFYGERNYDVVTITLASPGVFTKDYHNLVTNDRISLVTTGALPTGLSVDTFYYVIYVTEHTFKLSATRDGAAINTSVSQSGTHYFVSDKARRAIPASQDNR